MLLCRSTNASTSSILQVASRQTTTLCCASPYRVQISSSSNLPYHPAICRRTFIAAASSSSSSAAASRRAHDSSSNYSRFRQTRIQRVSLSVLLTGAIAAASICVACAAASDDESSPRIGSGGSTTTPAWLGDRITEAAVAGDLTRLRDLLSKHQPQEGVNITHRYGWTPLHAAVANNRDDVVAWLLEQPNIEVNKVDRYSPRARNLDQMIMKHSARGDAFPEMYATQPADGLAALHYAVLFASPEIVDQLIAAGADLDQQEGHGLAPHNLIDWTQIPNESTSDERIQELQEKKRRMKLIEERLQKGRKQRGEDRARQEKEERLRFPLELKLKKEMVGQDIPILSVAAAIRRRDNGWFDPSKPLVFLFLGSSGVGKTMLAKLLAQSIVKDKENGFIRIDMSEYQAKHEMSRLIGSPPGYVGHEEGGQLTTKLAKCPEAVILLDEVEKCHPDVLALMLSVFDEGRLTDGKGNTISCPKAIFIMTSNLVQGEIKEAIDHGVLLRPQYSVLQHLDQTTKIMRERGGVTTTPIAPKDKNAPQDKNAIDSTDEAEKTLISVPPITTEILPGAIAVPATLNNDTAVTPAVLSQHLSKLASDTEQFLRFIVHPILKRAFKRDEFLGRINDMIIFHPFSQADLEATVTMELNRWAQRAKERHSITLTWTPELVSSLTGTYDERYGYRSVIYGVEKRVVNVLASAHEREKIRSGSHVTLDVEVTTESGQHAQVVIRDVTMTSKEGETPRKKFLGLF